MMAFMAAGALFFGVAAYISLTTLWRLRREPLPGELGALLARQGRDED